MSIAKLCQPIELILVDVDGVLTDGTIIFDNEGIEIKKFNIRDGLGIRLWQKAGGRFGIITGRNSHIVNLRAIELAFRLCVRERTEKAQAAEEIAAELGLAAGQLCYIGDDLPDLPAVRLAGLGVAVADACEELRQAADYVTTAPGGRGAVRETIETILKAQSRWDELIRSFSS